MGWTSGSKLEPRHGGAAPRMGSFVLAGIFFAACSSSSDSGPGSGASDLVTETNAQGDELVGRYCECLVDDGLYESHEDCTREAGASNLSPAEERCVLGHYGRSTGARPYLECIVESQRAANECLGAAACGVDEIDECLATVSDSYDQCPPLPFELEALVALDCFGVDLGGPFSCVNGRVVPETYRCDLEDDCGDGTDEADCPGQFACEDGSGYLIETWICDGYADCPDASDEPEGCVPTTPPGFVCGDGSEIPAEWVCDAYEDCADGVDEADC